MGQNSPEFDRPSGVFADQLKARRKGNMSATELAQRVTDLGVPMTRELVERIERKKRQPKLDEVVALAAVLQCPLGVMLFGLDTFKSVGLSDETARHPDQWQQWLEGEDSAPGVSFTRAPNWKEGMRPVWAYQHLRKCQKRVDDLRMAVRSARFAGNTEALTERIDKLQEAASELAQHYYNEISEAGRPDWYSNFLKEMDRLRDGRYEEYLEYEDSLDKDER